MSRQDIKQKIIDSLKSFSVEKITKSSINLFQTLGYKSIRQAPLEETTYSCFKSTFLNSDSEFNEEKAMIKSWDKVDLLFQLSTEEISSQCGSFNTSRVDNTIIESYLFFCIELSQQNYTRTALSQITREINKIFSMPVMLLFKHGNNLTLSLINRRLNKKNEQRDVLEKVTLIKDINYMNPHRAHIEILCDLSFTELNRVYSITNFVLLHNAWQKTLDTKALNIKFYQEISNWYFWAMGEVYFPGAPDHARFVDPRNDQKVREHNAKNLIRLLTRLLFVWFIKEKNLVPSELFNKNSLREILIDFDPDGKNSHDFITQNSSYYRAILQNLFFASLNQTVGKREFRKPGYNRNVTNLMRYESYFSNSKSFVELIERVVPFMNGGLFECLDRPDENRKGRMGGDIIVYEDGFSDRTNNDLFVPDYIFFSDECIIDLSKELGINGRNSKIKGLINILESYKFTITENTPIEEDIALDPELLGRVFENLLASYNPETQSTARKQTGSFYTPRDIVNYMVDRSLKVYLKQEFMKKISMDPDEVEKQLNILFSYTENEHKFTYEERKILIKAIDDCKILDPACGSGAFPMGILHKLVYILHKLDPKNEMWKEKQIEKAQDFDDPIQREQAIINIESAFENNELDYGRKLYLIENCIYGVDIQPIAIQISKLRFFISLIVEQKVDYKKENMGVIPLPNLETKFVAANTLIGLIKPDAQISIFESKEIFALEFKLDKIRHRLFSAKAPSKKRELREEYKAIREQISELLINYGWNNKTAKQIANWDPYDQNAFSSFFDPEWMFGVSNGFNVVIGNPPYGASFSNIEKEQLYRLFKHQDYQLDSYLIFIEKGFSLCKDDGILCLIVPNTWISNLNFEKIRKYMLGFHFINISHYHKKVFGAIVDTQVIIIENTKKPNESIEVNIFDQEMNHNSLYANQNDWINLNGKPINIFTNDSVINVIKKIENGSILLSKIAKVIVGMKPYQKGKGQPKQTMSDVQNRIYDKILYSDMHDRKLLRGKDIEKFLNKWDGNRWIRYGEWLAEPRFSANFDSEEKIVIRQTGDSLIATIDREQFVCMNNMHVIQIFNNEYNIEYVLAIINSKLMNYYYQYLNPEKGEALAEVKKTHVEMLVIKPTNENIKQQIVTLVRTTMANKKDGLDTSKLENEIDTLVYTIYGLSEEEIKIIELN